MVLIAKKLWLRKWSVLVGLVIAAGLAILITFHVSGGFPPHLKSREHQAWVASSQVVIDSPISAEADLSQNLAAPTLLATVYGSLITTTSIVDLVAHAAGIPADLIEVVGSSGVAGQSAVHAAAGVAPGALNGYTLTLAPESDLPILAVSAQGPTRAGAVKLGEGVATGLSDYVTQLANEQNVPFGRRVVIRQMGAPSVAPTSLGTSPTTGAIIFLVLGFVWCALLLFAIRAREAWRAAPSDPRLSGSPPVAFEPRRIGRQSATSSSSTGAINVTEIKPEPPGGADGSVTMEAGDAARRPRLG